MGEQTVKKHKFKKWRKPGIRMQVMLGFVLFTAIIVTLLWTFQITLLNTFYKAIKVNEVRSVANRVVAMLDESASANDYFEVTRSTNISILPTATAQMCRFPRRRAAACWSALITSIASSFSPR